MPDDTKYGQHKAEKKPAAPRRDFTNTAKTILLDQVGLIRGAVLRYDLAVFGQVLARLEATINEIAVSNTDRTYARWPTPAHGAWSGEDRMAARLAHLSLVKQQRAMRAYASRQRALAKEKPSNEQSVAGGRADWAARVQLARQARATHLFRAFLKGTPYARVEAKLRESTLHAQSVIDLYYPADKRWGEKPISMMLEQWLSQPR